MLWPVDWDKPSDENSALCAGFPMGVWHGEGTFSFKYRYFKPVSDNGSDSAAPERKYPLVVHLHGADAFGDDNRLQLDLHDIGTMFARPEWQEHDPCYILVPQCDQYKHWARSDVAFDLQQFIISFTEKYKDIDTSRIYLYGYSAGGLGVFTLLKKYPEYYAGAIPICGATNGEDIRKLLKTPVWMVHAIDDRIVKATYGNPGEGSKFYLGSKDIYEILHNIPEKGSDVRYTEYPDGWMKKILGVNPHCSWVAVSDQRLGEEFRKWLFKQKRTK
ncbi:MAG: hypothetical protein K6G42_04315 [Lachnospiraceae bacterium]|nr:hypothetical protein [Lachnospiraceae bacterium]